MVWFRNVRPAVLAALLLVAVGGCASPMNTFDPKSDAADGILTIYIIVLVAASMVGFAVLVAMGWLLFRFRARPGVPARQIHGNNKLEISWTIAPVFVLLVVALPTMFWIAGTADDPDDNALEVTAIGHQWWFEFRYPGLGPGGTDLVTANELHIPTGVQVVIMLESDDVIHSFWVPQLVGKTDMIPGRTNELQKFKAIEAGVYHGQCVEFCGSAHALMQFRVHADTLGDFNRWVEAQNAEAVAPAEDSAESRGLRVFQLAGGCAGCHTISGSGGQIGPDLTLFGDRDTVGAGIMENTDENLRSWITDVRAVKPIPLGGTFMPTFVETLTEQQVSDVAVYLKSLTLD